MRHRVTIEFLAEEEEAARPPISLEFDHLQAQMFISYDLIAKGVEIDAEPNGNQKMVIECGNGVEPKDFSLMRYIGVPEGDKTHVFSLQALNQQLLQRQLVPAEIVEEE